MLEAYKIIHGPERKRGEEILVIPTAREGVVTRNAADPWNLVVPMSRLDIRKHNFSARIPEKWNKLPAKIKAAKNIVKIKNALKHTDPGL